MKLKKKKLEFENIQIYGEDKKEIGPFFLFIEPLQWNKDKHNGYVKPHLHSALYQIFVIKKGCLRFKTLNEERKIENACVILIPENMIHSVRFEGPSDGWTLSISLQILEELMQLNGKPITPSHDIKFINNLEGNTEFSSIVNLCELIHNEQGGFNPNYLIFNLSTVGLIINNVNKILSAVQGGKFDKREHKEYVHLRTFKKLIRKQIDASKKVSEYASEMCITSTHLNRVCKSVTNLSASQVINDTIVSEAKKYLIHSNFTISQITYILKFKSPSYFSKFFKKQVGQSPKKYREIRIES